MDSRIQVPEKKPDKKRPAKAVRIVLCVIVVAFVYFVFLEPLVLYFLHPHWDTHELDAYISEKYVKYKGGEQAAQYLPKYEETGDTLDMSFYYRNNTTWFRSLLYEEHLMDIFALDLQYETLDYEKEKAAVLLAAGDNEPEIMGNYICYELDTQFETAYCVALCDETNTVRHLVLTNWDLARDYVSLYGTLMGYASLEWNEM